MGYIFELAVFKKDSNLKVDESKLSKNCQAAFSGLYNHKNNEGRAFLVKCLDAL